MIEQKRTTSAGYISGELKRLTVKLEHEISTGKYPTLDEQTGLINKMEQAFFNALRNTHTSAITFKQYDILNPVKQASLVQAINWDISSGYDRIADVQIDLQSRMNKFFMFKRQVEDRVARANGVIQNTSVLNDLGVFELGDSFSDSNRIDADNPSSVVPMYQHRLAGIVTLPRKQATNIDPAQIIIMDSSNGFVPDGQELDTLSDNNPDTWFEYHREAIDESDDTKLQIDLLFKLKLPMLINLITISPLVLDDKAFPHIETIETSVDGRIYQDVSDSLPEFITKDEEDSLFTLGPVGFRNQSACEFVITPRICQFIKIRIRQSKKTEMLDKTFRQIIAIRDITIQQVEYQERGELLTTPLPLPFLAKRVLISQRIALTEPLTTVAYQISLDGGATYNPILPNIPLDINTGTPTSISVDGQKREARLRLTAVRNTENFNGIAAPLASTVKSISESFPLGEIPSTFSLRTLPIQDTLSIFRPLATIGKENQGTVISQGGGQDNLTINLPIKVKPFTETIKINGHAWTRVADFSTSDPDANEYTIDYNKGQLKFGDNTKGQVPESEIRLEVPAEKVVIPDTSPFSVNLDYSHDFNVGNIDVKWTGRPTQISQEILRRGSTEHPLKNKYIAQSVSVRELVPAGVTSFILGHIPLDRTALEFDDTVVFVDGGWTTSQLISDNKFSPVQITTTTATGASYPGYVEYEAIAKIVNQRSTYNAELFNSSELQIYIPVFSSDIFAVEQDFINGKDELTQAGDYSINFTDGIAYSFSSTSIDGNSSVDYYYYPKKDLAWKFGKDSKQLIIEDASVLVNKNDLNLAVGLKNEIRYFFIFKNNRFIWMPFVESYISDPKVRVDTADLTADTRPLQETTPVTNFTFVPSNDLIRGKVLPAGGTRVSLDHEQIVKNSVRFIFMSDNINSYNDRIVTKDSLNNITVSPKPVKDVYGNSLTGSSIGITTQRDVDKTTLTREVRFINGKDELLSGGDYSVDYENGVLYTVDPIPAYTIIQYEHSNISVSYVANQQLSQETNYTLELQNLQVTINSVDEALDTPQGSLLVRYDVVENFAQDPAVVQSYYTPILYGYKLKASKG